MDGFFFVEYVKATCCGALQIKYSSLWEYEVTSTCCAYLKVSIRIHALGTFCIKSQRHLGRCCKDGDGGTGQRVMQPVCACGLNVGYVGTEWTST